MKTAAKSFLMPNNLSCFACGLQTANGSNFRNRLPEE
jgi:hypothetical protein